MKKRKTKFFASPFIIFGLIFMLILMLGFWIFILFFPKADGRVIDDIPKFINEMGFGLIILMIFLAGICPILGFILTAHKGFSVFEISKKGVKRSLFRIFRKTEIRWDEMEEIRYYGMIQAWFFFSKTCLEGMPYNDIIKRKDVLQLEYSNHMVELIRSFTEKEIVNLPQELSQI